MLSEDPFFRYHGTFGDHGLSAIQDLMALPVLGEQDVILVGELAGEFEVAESHGASRLLARTSS